ncbi:DUF7507 domain-containing protein [Actinokineospora enzanensis]|uniref:DUF7507 domain-containing protein n=1 Tax=Actinokineospora enzanensis TaxID=155975 RepID=UPI0012EC63C2|nr:DUF11 domain-containing protein [Actinokineospora enzanensis]
MRIWKFSLGESGRRRRPDPRPRPGSRPGAVAVVLAAVLALLLTTGGPVFADPDPAQPTTSDTGAPAAEQQPAADPAQPADPGSPAPVEPSAPATDQSPTSTEPTEQSTEQAPDSSVQDSPVQDSSVQDSPAPDPGAPQPAPVEPAPRAAVDLAASVYAPEAAAPGAPITWLVTVTNNGLTNAAGFQLVDEVPATVTGVGSPTPGCSAAGNTVTCAGGALAAGASTVLRVTGTTPTPFVFPLVNLATVTPAAGDSELTTDDNSVTTVTTTATPDPQLGLTATAQLQDTNGNAVGDAGERITYGFTVHNTGNVTLFGLTVTHTGGIAVTCADTTLSLNESTTCTAPDHVVTAADVTAGQVVTSSAAHANAPDDGTIDSAPAVTNIPTFAAAPGIELVRVADLVDTNGDNLGEAGEHIDYRFQVSNSGNVPLTDIVVDEPGLGTNPCAGVVAALAPNETIECVRSPQYVITQEDAVNGAVVRTATATGTTTGGLTVTSAPSTTTTPTFVPAPAITLAQFAVLGDQNNDGKLEIGETMRYRSVLTNTGNVRLTAVSVVVTDGVSNPAGCLANLSLQPGETVECGQSLPYVVTPQDATAGALVRTARARGTSLGGAIALSAPITTTTPVFVPTASIGLTSTGELVDQNGNGIGDLGEPIQYTVTVTNTGNVALTDVIVEGTLGDQPEAGCAQAQLVPEQSATCVRALYYITQHDVDVGAVIAIGTAAGTAPDGSRVRSAPVTSNIPVFDPRPVLALVKDDQLVDDNSNGLADEGERIDYTFAVTNVGNVAVSNLAIQDAMLSGTTCPQTTLAPQQSTTCTSNASYVTTAADVANAEVVNTATATGTAPSGAAVTSPVSRTNTPTFVAIPALALDKIAVLGDADGDGLADLGETIQWRFIVVNNGNRPLFDLHIVDPLAGPVTCPVTTLGLLAVTTCVADAPHTVSEADILAGVVTNTATAVGNEGDADSPDVVSPPDSTSTPTAPRAPGLTLSKRADLVDLNDNDLADKGETINYTFVVTNTGNLTLTDIRVNDPKAGAVTCPVTVLAPGATTTCAAAPYIVTGDDVLAGVVRNIAVAFGTPPTGPPIQTPPAQAEVPVANPSLTLDKQAQLVDEDGDDLAGIGEIINYTFVVTNTGNVPLSNISVDDPKAGAVTCPVTVLQPGESTTCTAEPYSVTDDDIAAGVVRNIATASGQPPGTNPPLVTPPVTREIPTTEGTISGEDANQASSNPAITLVKSAALHDTDGDGLADEGETVDYTFLVTNTGDVDLTDVKVDDPKITGVVCPSTALVAGASVTCAAPVYTVTAADVASGSVHNVATADGVSPDGDTITSLPSETTLPVDESVAAEGAADTAATAGGGDAVLASTGTDAVTLLGWSLVLLTLGSLLLVARRGRVRKS